MFRKVLLGSFIFLVLFSNFDGYNYVLDVFEYNITDTEKSCDLLKELNFFKFPRFYPGTKWCGKGNRALNFEDLGYNIETDICCREHDFCPDVIKSGQTKHNLTNHSIYTRCNCKCDKLFYECLKKSHKILSSRAVGNMYFNALRTKCFRKDYPIIKCIKYHKVLRNRCTEYQLDKKKEKKFEWFDVHPF